MSPLWEYQGKLSALESALSDAQTIRLTTLVLLGATLLCLFLLAWLALEHRIPVWNAALPVPIAAAAVTRYVKDRSERMRLNRLRHFYQRGVERIEYRFAGRGYSGEEFRVTDHPYEPDVNLLGSGSLFELLCTARTEMGRRRLASQLLETPDIGEAQARQEAVRELAARPELREEIALLGKFDFRDSSGETFREWLGATGTITAGLSVRLLAVASSALLALLLVYGYFALPLTLESWIGVAPAITGLVAINAVIGIAFRRRSAVSLNAATRMGLEVGVLREGIALLQKQEFQSAKLRALRQALNMDDAARLLRRLERMTGALADCEQPFFNLFARLLIVRTQLWLSMEQWRSHHGDALTRWMSAWAEFEALAAVGGYAYEHPADCYPEFAEDETVLAFHDAGHPVLPEAACVRNDFTLGEERRFYIVSGSNMAGKSTLLRTVGMNVVLAYAGAPVRATSLRLSRFALFASLSVVDSLAEGKSKFLAEMEKLRKTMDSANAGKPVLFLIDEILSGTNSGDRRTAAEAIVRGLVTQGAMGALSTHDLALTEIAEIEELGGVNVHMSSRNGTDPMDFDYRLKPGVIRESNAIAIARMAGVMA